MDAKTVVMGMRERGGRVRAFVVRDNRRGTLLPRIMENVDPGATSTPTRSRRTPTCARRYVHHVINHAKAYVEGRVHTNNIENFWSVLKRTLGGTYVAPRPKHLDAYLDEQVFRFNERAERTALGSRRRSRARTAVG